MLRLMHRRPLSPLFPVERAEEPDLSYKKVVQGVIIIDERG